VIHLLGLRGFEAVWGVDRFLRYLSDKPVSRTFVLTPKRLGYVTVSGMEPLKIVISPVSWS
jgi:hypothetical protein